MTTLTKARKETRLILKWGGIALVLLFLLLVGIRTLAIIRENLTPPPGPQVSFGKLSPIVFPESGTSDITYAINTLSGFLPNFGDRVEVYQLAENPPTLLALDKAKEKVEKGGFFSDPVEVSENTYQWNKEDTLLTAITMNIFSSNFELNSDYLNSPLDTFTTSDEPLDAISLSEQFLSSMELLPNDLDQNKTKVSFYATEENNLIEVQDVSSAQIIRVDFFQKNIDDIPLFYESAKGSNLYFLTAKINNRLEIIKAYNYHKPISQTSSTYPIKSSQLAFSELEQGNAFIASNPEDRAEIEITNVYLGYYMSKGQDYFMPVVVFENEDEFQAFVSAVTDEWIDN
jgi:hypothetical protein